MTAVFHVAADLHLGEATPGIAGLFLDFLAALRAEATQATDEAPPPALYLLGDVFEYWAGDDDLDAPINATICAALREASQAGVFIGFLPGNRDFLIGHRFAEQTGVRLLPDPFILTLPSWQFALTHGDIFCTDDQAYQSFRQLTRDPVWQARFLAQPLAERKKQIEAIRQQSEARRISGASADPALMDVNTGVVDDFLRANGYPTLIHGHTHRPKQHDHIVDGIHCERWVVSDWHERQANGPGASGEILSWDGKHLLRRRLG